MIQYKINVIEELKKQGLKSTNAKQNRLFAQATMTKFRKGDTNISIAILNRLCCILDKQPCDILEYQETDDDRINILKRIQDQGNQL